MLPARAFPGLGGGVFGGGRGGGWGGDVAALTHPIFSLLGLSTPSPTNPFSLAEQPKPTLNQMRTSSPVPGLPAALPANSMTYSASLPLPLSSVPAAAAALPASASAFPQAGTFPELPSNLPQPLLPLSGPPAPPSAPGGLNPFL